MRYPIAFFIRATNGDHNHFEFSVEHVIAPVFHVTSRGIVS